MGSHDTDKQYIVYTGVEVFINILTWWWLALAETSRHYLK